MEASFCHEQTVSHSIQSESGAQFTNLLLEGEVFQLDDRSLTPCYSKVTEVQVVGVKKVELGKEIAQ